MEPNLILTGFMGTGKTTVGQLIAMTCLDFQPTTVAAIFTLASGWLVAAISRVT